MIAIRIGIALIGVAALFGAALYGRILSAPNDVQLSMNTEATSTTLSLTSAAFADGGSIPKLYTCDGTRTLHPPLSIVGVPKKAQTLALIMHDPDVPKAVKPDGNFDHWVLFNIPPTATTITEKSIVGTPGANGAGQHAYTGPCPPTQYQPLEHRYIFTLYALDTPLLLAIGATKEQVLAAMQGHIIGQAQLVGRYARPH